MAQDAGNVIVGQNGSVWVAPVGTTAPVNTTVAMGTVHANWLEVGFISEDGVTFSPSVENFEVNAWQSQGRPIRRGIASRSEELSFAMQEWNKVSLDLAFGGGTFSEIGSTDVFKYTPSSGSDEDEHAFVVHFTDGSDAYRLIVPRATVTDLAEFQLVRTDAASLSVTLGIVNNGTTDPWYLITPVAHFDPAA